MHTFFSSIPIKRYQLVNSDICWSISHLTIYFLHIFLFPCFAICAAIDFNEFYHYNIGVLLSALKSPAPSLPSTTDGEWETCYFQGSWVEGRTAGGSRNFLSHWQNPCFPFTVCDESAVTSGVNVRITLHQSRPDTDLHPIGFHVYKVSQTKGDYQCHVE